MDYRIESKEGGCCCPLGKGCDGTLVSVVLCEVEFDRALGVCVFDTGLLHLLRPLQVYIYLGQCGRFFLELYRTECLLLCLLESAMGRCVGRGRTKFGKAERRLSVCVSALHQPFCKVTVGPDKAEGGKSL